MLYQTSLLPSCCSTQNTNETQVISNTQQIKKSEDANAATGFSNKPSTKKVDEHNFLNNNVQTKSVSTTRLSSIQEEIRRRDGANALSTHSLGDLKDAVTSDNIFDIIKPQKQLTPPQNLSNDQFIRPKSPIVNTKIDFSLSPDISEGLN